MAWGDSGWGEMLQTAARPTCGGGSPELATYSDSDLSFQRGFGLWHHSDMGSSFRLPSSGSGRWWLLAPGRRFGQNSNTTRVTRSASSTTWTARWTSVKLLGWSTWHGRQHRRGNGVGRQVRVCLQGCHKPESRVPIYKPGTFLLMWEPDSIKSPRRIRG
jgi:hypothetical protein